MSHGYDCACTLCIVHHHAPQTSAEQCSHWDEVDDPEMGISDLERCGKCDRCSDANEAAYERSLEDYYGGSGPRSVQEQYEAAARQKRELDR